MTVQMNESDYTRNRVVEIISTLTSLTLEGDTVDGETMQYILEKVGMDNQMLRQLVMTRPIDEIHHLYEERVQLERL
jgi:hypothetical protein